MNTKFSGGGCLDGAAAEVVSGGTYQCRESGACYSIDDDTGLLVFTGHGPLGREMALIVSEMRREARDQAALDDARRARSCRKCGRTYLGSAIDVHQDGDRCLPGDAYGQLVLVDGAVWALVGSEAAR